MSKTYLVTFTPKEAYFFGNEKNFLYPGQKNAGQFGNKYYIKSEFLPSQSTLFGAVRYMLIPDKKQDYSYAPGELDDTIGAESFNIAYNGVQRFGVIEKMSPVFLREDETGRILIPTPKNHRIKDKVNDEWVNNEEYSPFEKYSPVETSAEKQLYASDFSSKHGLTNSFVCPDDEKIYQPWDIFGYTTRIGINRSEKDMFKKQFAVLKKGYSFAVYLTLKDSAVIPETKAVYLGQNKSLFEVNIEEKANDKEEKIKVLLKKGIPEDKCIIYCAGDTFADISVYDHTLFAAVTTKTYRAFTTSKGRVNKSSDLYSIISAGSVFIAEKSKLQALKSVICNANAEQVGYNIIITE